MTCVCQKFTIWYPNKNLMRKTSQKKNSKYRGSIYALSMFLHYPNYTHTNPNVTPGLIEVRKHFLVGLYSGGLMFGGG